jgi:four helix bundle protein
VRRKEKRKKRLSESNGIPGRTTALPGLLTTHSFLLFLGQMAFAFEKLLVYQKAIDFSDNVCQVTQTFPRGYFFLIDQLNRAALSIAANIAEGNGRFTLRDRKNFFGIARGSVQECVPLLELAKRRSLIQIENHLKLKADLEEIAKMLSGLINALDKRDS